MTRASSSPDWHLHVETELTPLVLQPDQAVPLTLLTNEAFTNALKYAGVPAGHDQAWVRVRLTREGDDHARLEVTNSIGAQERTMEGTGLGSQLIEAFAMQLEGEARVITTDTEYTLSLVFRIEEITPLPVEDRTFVVLTSAARDGARH